MVKCRAGFLPKNAQNFVNLSTPQYRNCPFNSFVEQFIRGGEIKFGSMGYKLKDNSGIFYEYGGENYLTWADFQASKSIPEYIQSEECDKMVKKATSVLNKASQKYKTVHIKSPAIKN